MGKQTTKKIPTTLSYVPIDPNSFPENYLISSRAVSESEVGENPSVLPYEGYNFMPTSYGYRSFFGLNTELAIENLPANADDIFMIQTGRFENILIALCDTGIWTKSATEEGDWEQQIELPLPATGTKLEWSHCIIQNTLYCYRQAGAQYYKFSELGITRVNTNVDVLAEGGLTQQPAFPVDSLDVFPPGLYGIGYATIAPNGDISPATAIFSAANITEFSAISAFTYFFPAIDDTYKYRIYVDFQPFGETEVIKYVIDNIMPFTANPERLNDSFEFRKNFILYADILDEDFVRTAPVTYSLLPDHFQPVVPTFINMEGQMGLFKAGSRLGFWDSANAIATSNIDDFTDFKPAVKTLAGISTFQEVTGRIINILSSGDGFIIYSTKSIIYIERNVSATLGFAPRVIIKNAGISFRRECCAGASDTIQFAYTPIGLYQITNGNGQVIIPEVTDFLKDSKEPVYLKIIAGRYLFLEVLDGNYTNGLVSFTTGQGADQEYKFINDYLNGVGEGQAEAIDSYILQEGLSVRLPNSKITTILEAAYVDQEIVRPIPQGVPPIDDVIVASLPNTYYTPDRFIIPSRAEEILSNPNVVTTNAALFAGPRPTGTLHTINKTTFVLNSEIDTGASDPANYPYLKGELAIIPGETRFPVEELTIEAEFYRKQNELWLARDLEVSEWINYLNAFSDKQKVFYFPRQADETDGALTISKLLIFTDLEGDLTIIGGEPNPSFPYENLAYPPVDGAYPLRNLGAIASAWGQNTISFVGNVVRYRRYRTGVAAVFSKVTGRFLGMRFPDYRDSDLNNSYSFPPQHLCTECKAELVVVLGDSPVDGFSPYQEATLKVKEYVYESVEGELINIPAIEVNYEAPSTGNEYPPIPNLVFPGSSFLLQKGGIGPIYPTIESALVYDMQLKKWGKVKQDYKLLLDYSPINNTSTDLVDFETFGMQAGILTASGKVKIFDKNPIDSMLRYGKIGYEREGFTSAEEFKVSFRSPSTGTITIESSLNGALIDSLLTKTETYTNSLQHVMYPSSSARWHTYVFKGNFDIKYLEYRGSYVGNR